MLFNNWHYFHSFSLRFGLRTDGQSSVRSSAVYRKSSSKSRRRRSQKETRNQRIKKKHCLHERLKIHLHLQTGLKPNFCLRRSWARKWTLPHPSTQGWSQEQRIWLTERMSHSWSERRRKGRGRRWQAAQHHHVNHSVPNLVTYSVYWNF